MTDLLVGFLFLVVYELFSWPLRLAISPIPMAPDVRRLISRAAGPPIVVFAAWFAAHFGVPLGGGYCWIWWGLFLSIGLGVRLLARRAGGAGAGVVETLSPVTLTRNRRLFRRDLFVELLGVFVFFSFLWFRMWNPEMTTTELNGSGAEKFDNAMFFWSSWHARTLPPEDYWLAGNRLPYYYFGHFFWAWIGKAGFFPGEWVITLAMARLVMLTWETGMLLIRAFGARPVAAALGGFAIAWSGNPAAVNTTLKQFDTYSGRAAEQRAWDAWKVRADQAARAGGRAEAPPPEPGFRFAPRYLKTLFEKPEAGRPAREWDWYGWGAESGYRYWETAHGVFRTTRTSNVHTATIVEHPAWTAIHGDFHAHHFSMPWGAAFVALIVAGPRWFRFRRRDAGRGARQRDGSDDDPDAPDRLGERDAGRSLAGAPGPEFGFMTWLAPAMVVGIASIICNLWVAGVMCAASLGVLLWRLGWGWFGWGLRVAFVVSFVLGTMGAIRLEMGSLSNRVTDKKQELSSKELAKLPDAERKAELDRRAAEARAKSEARARKQEEREKKLGEMGFFERIKARLDWPREDWNEARLPVRFLDDRLKSTKRELFDHWGFHVSLLLGALGLHVARTAGASASSSRRRGASRDGSRRASGREAFRASYAGPVTAILLVVGAATIALKFLPFLRNETAFLWLGLMPMLASLLFAPRPFMRPLALAFLLATCFLLAGLEVFYIDDGMGGMMQRYNTYFKHAMALWPMLCAGAWMGAIRLWNARPAVPRGVLRFALVLMIPLASCMVVFGGPARLKMAWFSDKKIQLDPKRPSPSDPSARVPTLDAFAWLRWIPDYEPEEQMLRWIRDNVPPGDRVAETVNFTEPGRIGYIYVGRVASLAGRPVPVGWEQHIFTWRGGGASEPVRANRDALYQFYYAPTPEAMKQAARKLGIKWAVFGKTEREVFRGKEGDIRNADAVYRNLRGAAEVAAMFPRNAPRVFVFHFRD